MDIAIALTGVALLIVAILWLPRSRRANPGNGLELVQRDGFFALPGKRLSQTLVLARLRRTSPARSILEEAPNGSRIVEGDVVETNGAALRNGSWKPQRPPGVLHTWSSPLTLPAVPVDPNMRLTWFEELEAAWRWRTKSGKPSKRQPSYAEYVSDRRCVLA